MQSHVDAQVQQELASSQSYPKNQGQLVRGMNHAGHMERRLLEDNMT